MHGDSGLARPAFFVADNNRMSQPYLAGRIAICCGGLIPSIVAIITGYMARSKAVENPNEFGGAGLAMGGMITGVLGLVLGIVLIILQIVFGVLSNLN